MYQSKPVQKVQSSKPVQKVQSSKRGRTASTPKPQKRVCNDENGHWSIFHEKKNKCRLWKQELF